MLWREKITKSSLIFLFISPHWFLSIPTENIKTQRFSDVLRGLEKNQ